MAKRIVNKAERNAERYDAKETGYRLFEDSQNGKTFDRLMPLIVSELLKMYHFSMWLLSLIGTIISHKYEQNYSPRSFPFSRSGSLGCRKMLSMFCLITSYSLTCFFSLP